jgi:hypothetical protein
MRSRIRTCLWGAVAILAAAALLPAAATGAAGTAAGAAVAPIDLNAPITDGSQCMPCHADLATTKTPGLIFSHGTHLLMSCDSCHTAPPHTGGGSVPPSMATCFNCHGLIHNGKELAKSACTACHTRPRSQLIPLDHKVPGYAGVGHVAPSQADINSCLLCHTAQSCDDCHARTDPKAPPTQPRAYQPILLKAPRRPAVDVAPNGNVTMAQCVNCHPDLDKFLPGRVIFAHAVHTEKGFACKDCHRAFPHGPDTTSRPDMPSCYSCHGLVHASRGMVATDQCPKCHPAGFALKPADHTAAFVAKDHRIAANAEPANCAMCHQPDFCTNCHQGRPKVPGGPPRPKVMPADHKKGSFLTSHGKTFLAQRGACGSCHDSASCEACHKTPMPHPADWTSGHALVRNLDSNDCNVCHTDRTKCQECHHNNLRGQLLIEANCVRCHPIMRTKPATSIQDKGLAEHAVHFDVASRPGPQKGTPFRCEDCHVGFQFVAVQSHAGGSALSQAHDLRLCYECHGALNFDNVLIAPYPGAALCLRCHRNLNF